MFSKQNLKAAIVDLWEYAQNSKNDKADVVDLLESIAYHYGMWADIETREEELNGIWYDEEAEARASWDDFLYDQTR